MAISAQSRLSWAITIVAGAYLASCGGEVADGGIVGGGDAPSTPSPLPPTPASSSGEEDASRAEAAAQSPGGMDSGTGSGPVAVGDANDASVECAAFVASSPADEKTRVGVFEDVTLDYCGDLDPATVTNVHVELLAPHATVGRKAVAVRYDAPNRRIVIHPTLPMDADATYRVRATGLRAAGGTAIGDVAFSFHTVRSPMVRAYGPIGGLQSSEVGTLDAEGRLSRWVVFYAGPDGVGGTADDVDSGYGYTYEYSSTGYTTVSSSVGADGVFDTSDDVVYDIVGRENSEVAAFSAWTARTAGPDGKLGTADDGYINCGRQFYTDDGRPAHIEWFKNAGADGIPFTDDDPIMNYSTFDDTTPGHPQVLRYGKPGPDGQWHTPDDVLSGLDLYTDDALGRMQLRDQRQPGPDGILQTADDTTYQIYANDYDARGLLSGSRGYYNPGPDQIWLTADDILWNVSSYSYDPAGNVTSFDSAGVHYVYAPQL